MGSFSDYLENQLLRHAFKIGAYTQPTNLYVALSTADPTDDGSGIAEPVGSGYARKNHNAWVELSNSVVENDGEIVFDEATGNWGTISHFAIFDALTGGNMLGHGAVTTPKAFVSGDTARIPDGDIQISLD